MREKPLAQPKRQNPDLDLALGGGGVGQVDVGTTEELEGRPVFFLPSRQRGRKFPKLCNAINHPPPPRPPPLPNASPEGLADLGLQFLLERLTFTTPVAGFSKHFRGKLIFQRSPEALWALTEHWWDRPGRREKKKNNPGAFLMFNTIQAH